MKIHHHIILIITACLLACCAPVQAGWFSGNDEREALAEAEGQLESQRATTDQWEVIAGVLGVGCVLLLVIGTALGAKTRHASRT